MPWACCWPFPARDLKANCEVTDAPIAALVDHALHHQKQTIEVTREAEDAWLELLSHAPPGMIGTTECTPGYYNNEGKGWAEYLYRLCRSRE